MSKNLYVYKIYIQILSVRPKKIFSTRNEHRVEKVEDESIYKILNAFKIFVRVFKGVVYQVMYSVSV